MRRVVLVAPTQLVKTDFAISCALYFAHYGDSSLFVEPDKELLMEMFRDRIRPGAVAPRSGGPPPAWRARISRNADSMMGIRVEGAGSVTGVTPQMKSGLAARSVPVVVFDEIDLMGRTDLMTRAESRITTFGTDGRIVAGSTPTVEGSHTIWHLWETGSRGVWKGRCVACSELMPLDWDTTVRLDKTEEGFWKPETAVLVCTHCGHEYSEPERLAAVRSGGYVHERYPTTSTAPSASRARRISCARSSTSPSRARARSSKW